MKKLINEEVKKLQKIAGLLNENLEYTDPNIREEDTNIIDQEKSNKIDKYIANNFSGVKKQKNPGKPLSAGYTPISYYTVNDKNDPEVKGILVQNTEDGIAYWIKYAGERIDPEDYEEYLDDDILDMYDYENQELNQQILDSTLSQFKDTQQYQGQYNVELAYADHPSIMDEDFKWAEEVFMGVVKACGGTANLTGSREGNQIFSVSGCSPETLTSAWQHLGQDKFAYESDELGPYSWVSTAFVLNITK